VQKSGAKDESSRSGTLTVNGTHASERGAAARKVEWGPALREFENFVGSRFTPACNTSAACRGRVEVIEDIDNMPVARVESVPFLAVTSYSIVVYLYTLVVTKHIESI
jgi:hypothetical protein